VGLILDGVGYVYGRGTAYAQRALEGVTLAVEPGRMTVVLGATGSGKSTLLRLAAGLEPPSEGRVTVDGVDTALSEARSIRGSVGLVFQRPESQLFAETVADDVAFGPRNLGRTVGEAREDAERALLAVGLDPAVFGPRSPFTLSGGEARRVAVAGVLAMRPAYLLLDEPTAGLDAEGRSAVLASVQRAREDAGIVVVTHDAEEFLPLADTVLVLRDGATAFAGSPAELLADAEPLEAAGLALPAVLEVQLRAREAGAQLPLITLDPALAAEMLAAAEWRP
jgi:energy-coupling factor transport system ATP-binding protein